MTKALTAEQETMKASGKYVGVFPFEFAEQTEKGAIPSEVHLIPIGQWDHDLYGPIVINASDIQQFKRNFEAGIRKGVFITAGHEGFEELPAQGWITAVDARDTGLWGTVEWNELGKETLSDKQFKFFSPEFYLQYADPETHEVYERVLTGGALTKSPYFKELQAVVFSDKNISNKLKFKNMDIQTILKKKASERTAEEKDFLEQNKDSMSEDEKTSYAEVDEEDGGEQVSASEKEAKEKGDANEAAGLNRDGSKKIVANEKGMVQMSEAEYKVLSAKANEGAAAFAELSKAKLNTAVKGLVMSEGNKTGRFLPKTETALATFMEKLDDTQRKAFADLIGQLPKADVFGEKGDSGASRAGTVMAEVNAKVDVLMASDKNLKYADAVKRVFGETPGLQDRYDAELQG